MRRAPLSFARFWGCAAVTAIRLAACVALLAAFVPPAPAQPSRVPSIGRPEPRRAQRDAESEPADHSHLPAFLLRPVRARV